MMKIKKIAYHRNGISGAPFTVGIVEDMVDEVLRDLLIIQFDDKSYTAVFDLDLIKEDVIEFGQNSWRGDHFSDKFKELTDDTGDIDG